MFFLERCVGIRDEAEMASLPIVRAYGFRTMEDFRAARKMQRNDYSGAVRPAINVERDPDYRALWAAAVTMVRSVTYGIQMSERLFAQYEEGVITDEEYIIGVINRLADKRQMDGIC